MELRVKKLYSVQRKVSKQPKIKGPAAFQPNGLKIMHGGGGGVSPSGKIPLYLNNMGALPSTPTEEGIIHCVFLNFCVILNSIPLDFVVEETPGLDQGSCRKTLGPQFSRHKYPLVKIHVSVMGGFPHLQDWAWILPPSPGWDDRNAVDGLPCWEFPHSIPSAHKLGEAPSPHTAPIIPWPHSRYCLLQGKTRVEHSLNIRTSSVVVIYEKGSCSSGTEIQINQNLLSAAEISISCRERRQREGARLGLAHSRGRDTQHENRAWCLPFLWERSFTQTWNQIVRAGCLQKCSSTGGLPWGCWRPDFPKVLTWSAALFGKSDMQSR